MGKPDFRQHFTRGVEHFNAGEFWEAHESWEELWLAAESDLVEFLQGLIQLAAAYHHVKRGTWRGAVRLFDASLRRLDPFPVVYCGLDRSAAVTAARDHRERTARSVQSGAPDALSESEYPRLSPVPEGIAPIPPIVQW
jgi:uncharacterized protein